MSVAVEFRGDREGVAFDDTVGWEFNLNVGRRSWSETVQPAILELSVVWSSASLGTVNIDDWQLGDKIKLQFRVPAVDTAWYSIFYGAVTDVSVNRDVIRVVAVDIVVGSLGRTWIDVPEQTNVTLQTAATAVVSAAQTAGALLGCSVSYQGLTQDNVTVPAQTNVNALQALNSLLASEPSGCLGTRIGNSATTPELRVCGLNARRVASMPSTIKYDLSGESDAFFYEWRVEKRVSDLVNKAVISYNDNGTQTFTDTASVAAVGTYAVAVNTNLNQATDADYLARRYVLRNNDPAWRVEPLTVDMRKLTDTLCYNLGRYIATTGSWIRIPALYVGAQTDYFIEGFSDSIRYSTAPGGSAQWFRTFYVTDVNATDAPQRWQDVTSGVTWATVNPAYTWLDLEEIDI